MFDLGLLASQKVRPLKRSEYDRLVALGAFADEHLELLHGILVERSPSEPPHAATIDRLNVLLVHALGAQARVRIQQPLVAFDESEPEPDIAVVPPGDYDDAHPASVHLVIEVADSSLRKDRLIKGPLYAASGFSEYWIVNLRDRVVEVHRAPAGESYGEVTRHTRGDTLRPAAFPNAGIAVSDFLR